MTRGNDTLVCMHACHTLAHAPGESKADMDRSERVSTVEKTERALDISISSFWFLDFCIAAAIYLKKKKHERRTKRTRSARFLLCCRLPGVGCLTSPAAVSTSPAPPNQQIPKHDRSIDRIDWCGAITNQSTKPTPSPLGPRCCSLQFKCSSAHQAFFNPAAVTRSVGFVTCHHMMCGSLSRRRRRRRLAVALSRPPPCDPSPDFPPGRLFSSFLVLVAPESNRGACIESVGPAHEEHSQASCCCGVSVGHVMIDRSTH